MAGEKPWLPLRFAPLPGGQLTLIGSASNLIVMGLCLDWPEETGLQLADGLELWGPAFLAGVAA